MDSDELKRLTDMSLDDKIQLTKKYIVEYYEKCDGKIYVSFSGGKDSTVLLNIVREIYPDVVGMFVNTGLEYPEIKDFVRTKNNIIEVKPKMTFKDVINKYGYPIISKQVARSIDDLQNPTDKNKNIRNLYLTGYTMNGNYSQTYKLAKKWKFLIDAPFKISSKCCDKLKKEPMNEFEKKHKLNRIIGVMASESSYRRKSALDNGINIYGTHNICSPLLFWTENDILKYILKYNIEYCSVYGDIIVDDNGNMHTTLESRTGCMFCMFGVQYDNTPNRFQRMKITHPNQYNFCIDNLGCGKVLDFVNIPYK